MTIKYPLARDATRSREMRFAKKQGNKIQTDSFSFVCTAIFPNTHKNILFFSVAQLKWLGYMEISHPTLFSHPQSIKDMALNCTNKEVKKSNLMGRL